MRKKLDVLQKLILLFLSIGLKAQQVPDTLYTPQYFEPSVKNKQSIIYIDEAHNNFHTAGNRYKPFAALLQKDGFIIKTSNSSFEKGIKANTSILVISNALSNEDANNWNLPNSSAFTAKEINVLNAWVKNGGSLFLIADHMPFAGAAADLAASFGFRFYDGFAIDSVSRKDYDLFSLADKNLATNDLTKGIDSIATFTGQGFDIPREAVSILTLGKDFKILLPENAWEFNAKTKRLKGESRSQLAILKYGKGKIVVSGEAAMFTAQLSNNRKVGMNAATAKNNYLLLLSLIRWLNASL